MMNLLIVVKDDKENTKHYLFPMSANYTRWWYEERSTVLGHSF